jgi:hypothetical protein
VEKFGLGEALTSCPIEDLFIHSIVTKKTAGSITMRNAIIVVSVVGQALAGFDTWFPPAEGEGTSVPNT